MVYPERPVLETLPQFRGTNVCRPTSAQRAELLAFVAERPASYGRCGPFEPRNVEPIVSSRPGG